MGSHVQGARCYSLYKGSVFGSYPGNSWCSLSNLIHGEGNPPPHVPHRYDRGVAYACSDITELYLLILCEASAVRRNDLHLHVGHIDGSSWTGDY